jgi:hypothetical protein
MLGQGRKWANPDSVKQNHTKNRRTLNSLGGRNVWRTRDPNEIVDVLHVIEICGRDGQTLWDAEAEGD